MPLTALVGDRILCMHGGISPQLKSLQQLREIKRPMDVSSPSLEMDLLWADPVIGISGFQMNMRGASFGFGSDILATLCKELNIDMVRETPFKSFLNRFSHKRQYLNIVYLFLIFKLVS